MSTSTVMVVSRLEARHLADLVGQFASLVEESDARDPAVERLTPDAYPDDADANAQFRGLARSDLLGRRATDAGSVLATLLPVSSSTEPSPAHDDDLVELALDADAVGAWMRTLAAIRLVLASRLGIESEEDRDEDDPRFGVYDWIGYRLEGLLQATDPG